MERSPSSRGGRSRRSRSERSQRTPSRPGEETRKRSASQKASGVLVERVFRDRKPYSRRRSDNVVDFDKLAHDEIFHGGVRKMSRADPRKQANVDNIIFGYEMDDAEMDLTHVKGAAGVHLWGRESDYTRYNSDNFTRGKGKIDGGPMIMSTIKYAAFNDENDPRRCGETGKSRERYRRMHDGAVGAFSDEIHANEANRGKKLYPNAPQAQTSVDDLLLNRDLQDTAQHAAHACKRSDWYEAMEGAAGVPRWNWVDQRDRFTAVLSAKAKNRLGRKPCKGAANLETNVDYCLFGHDLDRKYHGETERKEKDAWVEHFLITGAGRLGAETFDDKFRFMPQTEHDKRLGKRMYENAPQQECIVDSIGFNMYLPDKNTVEGAQWDEVVKGCAGLGFNRNKDAIYGRYHIDEEHAQGKVAGRRLYGTPFTQVLVPEDVAESEFSKDSWGNVGRSRQQLESKRVRPEATTSRDVYRHPSDQAVSRAARRSNKHGHDVQKSEGVSAAMRSHDEETPRRVRSPGEPRTKKDLYQPLRKRDWEHKNWEGALAPSPDLRKLGPSARSLYVRDFCQLPVGAYKEALEVAHPAYFDHPEREFRKGDEEMEQYYMNSVASRYRDMTAGRFREIPPQEDKREQPEKGKRKQEEARGPGALREAAGGPSDVPMPPKLLSKSNSMRETQGAKGSDVGSRSSRRASSARGMPRDLSARRSGSTASETRRALPTPPSATSEYYGTVMSALG